jgi:predicted ATPase
MARIEIKNIGPIKEASFKLNKVNVFMGPQSSGKSTIAKIISYCTWVEKRRILDGFFRENFLGRFKEFHNLEDVYFPSNAYFKYDGEYCDIEFSNGEGNITVKEVAEFKNRKQIYIPAERNFVASIPNLGRYKEKNNNILDFLYYWYEAKKSYHRNAVLNIPELKIEFRHVEDEDKDVIVLGKGKEIILQNASSGVQSMLPLYLLFDYLTSVLYKRENIISPFEKSIFIERMDKLIHRREKIDAEQFDRTVLDEYEKMIKQNDAPIDIDSNGEPVYNIIFRGRIFEEVWYNYSQFIIEEPEQNLFPTTQRDLIYYMLRVLNDSERDHRLTLTTHSPYILYALNNCMMAGLVYDKMNEQDKAKLKCRAALINPEKVSVYQIEDGTLRKIQQADGLIVANYFDDKMKELMNDFYVMLNYYAK